LSVDPVDPEVDCAPGRLGEGLRQLKRATSIPPTTSLRHEGAQAVVVMLENDRDVHVGLGDQVQFPARQRLPRQGFLGPVVISNYRANPCALELEQEIRLQLLSSIRSHITLASFTHWGRAGRGSRRSEGYSNQQ